MKRLLARMPASRLTRVTSSFLLVLVSYSAYALIAVPLIEPNTAAPRRGTAVTEDELDKARQAPVLQRAGFERWFAEDAWELTNPKVIEAGQARVLAKTYTDLGQGRMKIHPCTIVMLPARRTEDEEEWLRQAVILQAPDGAVLQFDRALNLREGKIGNLTSGELNGPITIRSDYKSPGAEDDLFIEARDAHLSGDRITSDHPVRFRFGANHGQGQGLLIELVPGGGSSSGARFDGIRGVQLQSDVNMFLDPASSRAQLAGYTRDETEAASAGETAAPDLAKAGPMTIQCVGPFRFDLEKQSATFRDQVDVVRARPDGPSDTLRGELVAVHFANAAAETDPASAATVMRGRIGQLEPALLEAQGDPVVVRSPASDVEARGQRLTYNLKTGAGSLEGRERVFLRRGASEIHAPSLHFEGGTDGAWGTFSAGGPGHLEGRLPDGPDGRVRASWQEQLDFRPHENQQLLSLKGAAHVEMEGRGQLRGDSIHLWLRPDPRAAAADEPASPNQRLTPDRLLARGNVAFELAELQGAVGELHAWFDIGDDAKGQAQYKTQAHPAAAAILATSTTAAEDRAAPSAQQKVAISPALPATVVVAETAGTATTPTGTPRTAAKPIFDAGQRAGTPARPRFHVRGGLLEVQIVERDGGIEMTALEIRENVQLIEKPAAAPGDEPLVLRGDRLEMIGTEASGRQATLTGQPGHVHARSMTLEGGRIELDQRANRVTVTGPGMMALPVDRDLEGNAVEAAGPLKVTWQEGMQFDGLRARFDRGVVAQLAGRTLRTERMDVSLLAAVNLMQPDQDQRPDVDRIQCHGDVYARGQTHEQAGLVSIEQFRAANLAIHAPSGDIRADGPGWFTLVRYGTSALSGDPLVEAVRGQQRPAAPRPADEEPGFTYVGVTFQGDLTGNLRARHVELHDRVATVYGPVGGWDDTIELEVFDRPDPPGILLRSDRLSVVQMQQGGQRSVELDARGNATMEGRNVYARAERMSYVEAKDQIVLEGGGRANAELWRQLQPGLPSSRTAARKILYWRSTNHIEVDDVELLDLNLLSSEGGRGGEGPARR